MTDQGDIGILVRGLSIVVVAGEPPALPWRSAVSRQRVPLPQLAHEPPSDALTHAPPMPSAPA